MTLPLWLTPRRLALIAVAVVVAVVAYQRLTTPRHGTPEAAIAAVLDAGAAAAREGRVKDMMGHVSAGYQGGADGGPATRDELRGYLLMGLARGGTAVQYLSRDIEVDGAVARVSASLIVDGRALELALDFALEDDAWRVVASGRGVPPAPPP